MKLKESHNLLKIYNTEKPEHIPANYIYSHNLYWRNVEKSKFRKMFYHLLARVLVFRASFIDFWKDSVQVNASAFPGAGR